MKSLLILMLVININSCSAIKVQGRKEQPEKLPIIKVETLIIGVGKVKQYNLVLDDYRGYKDLYCKDHQIPYQVTDKGMFFFIAESYFSNLESYDCYLEYQSKKGKLYKIKALSVIPRKSKFKEEKLNVDSRRVKLSDKDLSRVLKEQLMLNKVYMSSHSQLYIKSPFLLPLKSKLTSLYGTKRTFNGVKKGQHLGNDFRAAMGTVIKSSNVGKVVVSRDLFYAGRVVILDHGLGVFTVYAHLSKAFVKEGDMVDAGQKIGLSGRSGRVTGPHLHWGTKIHGQWIDGFSLISSTEGMMY